MSIDVIQSQHPEILLREVINHLIQPAHSPQALFRPRYFIVPGYGTGQWLQQKIAEQISISANLKFAGLRTFQWELYQQVLGYDVVAKAPQMLNMKWRIYLFLSRFLDTTFAESHPLSILLQRIHQHSDFMDDPVQRQIKQQSMLYWVADHTSRLFANYIIYRGQCVQGCVNTCQCRQNWLGFWGRDQALPIQDWIQKPEKEILEAQPDVLNYAIEQAQTLEMWQRYIWKQEFADDFAKMQKIDTDFWAVLAGENAAYHQAKLPQQLYVFTVLELPPSQLYFLRRLAQYISVKVFHYTPSQEYWADSVDPKWKAKYALKYPNAAVYYESRHPLLTRLGKQARDISALLSQLAGGEEGLWEDYFPEPLSNTLLAQIQSDILYLCEPIENSYSLAENDQSIQIHVCHSTLRQLEVLKDQLLHWLSEETGQKRHASDVVVLVPNLQEIEPLIRTVFTANFEAGQVSVPIKIAGVPQLDSVQLWQSLTLRIKLLQQRFTLEQLIDWLSLTPTQCLYQLNFEDIQRMSELLQLAGFKRGFDDKHLGLTLSADDQDFRFTLRYALDRLSLAIAMPEHAVFADVLSLCEVRSSDFTLIAKLIEIYQDLDRHRDWLVPQAMEMQQDMRYWLEILRLEIEQFAECTGVEQVYDALRQLKRIIEKSIGGSDDKDFEKIRSLKIPLHFILDEIANTLEHQVAQTEPTGQVTFAQMGQLRPLPYRLVVCLNLDTGTFPNRDHHIPFDLMELLRAELGDRSRLEDDQGAFLDAMLLAQEGFWLFYNGYDVNDTEVRDPSSIVQELVSHLQLVVKRESSQPEKIEIDGIEIPRQLAQLYYMHALQPFDPKDFTQPRSHRFINQWFYVAEQIEQPQTTVFQWLNRDYPLQQSDLQVIDAQQWIKDLSFPAQHFLRHASIRNIEGIQQLEGFEPLQLNGLQKYGIRDYLQQTLQQSGLSPAQEMALLQDKLPVGKMQVATLQLALGEHDLLVRRLAQYGGRVTPVTQKRWQYNQHIRFLIFLPEQSQTTHWVSLTASGCHNERPLKIWLEYLLWRASNDSTENLQRIALFNNVTLIIAGLSQQQARDYIHDWLDIWSNAQSNPFILPPALFTDLIKNKIEWQFDAQGIAYCKNYEKLEKRWLGLDYDKNSPIKNHQDQGCALYPDWALLLAGRDIKALLNQFTERYAARLYQPLIQHIKVEEQ